MPRRRQPTAPEAPAAGLQPALVAAPIDVIRAVTLRAGHRHRGIVYAEHTPYRATPAEVELLRRYGALVEN
ncbi:hypothetical protein V3391_06505 [Luteimonas sp. SMYT11W]|uniref:Uncharacterized protein n=1 Tax=Luteimonas flava TaxID=3115822 RepID=A0ABU7WEE0_9GAMM